MQEKETRPLWPVLITVFIDLLGYGIVIPVLAPLFLGHGSTLLPPGMRYSAKTAVLGALIACYPLAQFFGAPILGALSDRYGRRRVLLLSLAGTCVDYLFFAVGIGLRHLGIIFIGRIIAGFTGGSVAVVNSAIADVSDERTKPRNFGYAAMAFGIGFIIGPFIGGKLSDPSVLPWFDFATPFWFAAALTAGNVLFVLLRFRETLATRIATPVSPLTGFRNFRRAFSIPNLRTLFLVILLLTFGFNFFTLFFPVFLIERFSFSQSAIGDIFAYAGLWIALVQGTVTGPLSRRYRPARLLGYSMFGLGLTLPLLVLPRNPFLLYTIFPFIALFQGLTTPNSVALISSQASPDSQGEVMGILQSFQSAGQAVPPLISGLLVALHVNLPILIASLCTLAAWAVFVLAYRFRGRETFHEV